MWKFASLLAIFSTLFVGIGSELMCHQKGDYCQVKDAAVAENLTGKNGLRTL